MSKRMFLVPLVLAMVGVLAATTVTQRPTFVPIAHEPFYVQSYTGKCLTYGTWDLPTYPGDPPPTSNAALYMDTCSQPGDWPRPDEDLLQRIVVTESTGTMTSSSTPAAR